MKKTDIAIGGLLYALYMFVSCLVSMLAEMFIVRVITLFVYVDPFALCIIRAVIYTLFVNAILGLAAFYEGYKNASWRPVETGISGFIALLAHFLVSMLFSFEAFCSGGVKFYSALFKFGSYLSSGESFKGVLTREDCIGVFFINGIIYLAVMITAQYFGAKKRLKDRKELLTHTEETNQ